jgi:hypothetical protein
VVVTLRSVSLLIDEEWIGSGAFHFSPVRSGMGPERFTSHR